MDPVDLERLELAFALHMCLKIAEADDVIKSSELSFLASAFPKRQLLELGLIDEWGKVAIKWEDLADEGKGQLVEHLPEDRKLAIITVLHNMCWTDKQLDHREVVTMIETAEALGLPPSVLKAHIDKLEE